jgi:hypothetical protein
MNNQGKGRKPLDIENCNRLILKQQEKIARYKEDYSLVVKTYDYNFSQITACEKKSEKHLMLLLIENLLNNEGLAIAQRIALAEMLADNYRAKIIKAKAKK